ncbi:MAG: FixH family protein [Gammaproteobacteria bacterium]|nr:FixH family protein [Gammaproteobacteria bacterium]
MQQNEAWYKNPWVWLIIAFPMSAVVAGIATVIITSQNQPEMVIDDYYKKGKAINQELTLYNKAAELGVDLQILVKDGQVQIKTENKYPALKVSMVHSTLGDKDFSFVVSPNAIGTLSGSVEQDMSGKWQIIVSPMDNSWKVKSQLALPYSDWVQL